MHTIITHETTPLLVPATSFDLVGHEVFLWPNLLHREHLFLFFETTSPIVGTRFSRFLPSLVFFSGGGITLSKELLFAFQ